MGVVEQQGVGGLAQRALLARGVDAVTLLHVGQHLFEGGAGVALALQLLVASLGAHLGAGGDKHLELGVGEHHGAYVAAVHHYALVAAHSLLLCHHGTAHEADGRHQAHLVAHLHAADLVLHVAPVEVGLALALGVDLEGDLYLGHVAAQTRLVHLVVLNHVVLQAVERHGAVHGAGVDVGVAYAPCQSLSHRALAARRVAVDCNSNKFLFHIILFCRDKACLVRWLCGSPLARWLCGSPVARLWLAGVVASLRSLVLSLRCARWCCLDYLEGLENLEILEPLTSNH